MYWSIELDSFDSVPGPDLLGRLEEAGIDVVAGPEPNSQALEFYLRATAFERRQLTRHEEAALVTAARAGDSNAEVTLLEANLRLAAMMALRCPDEEQHVLDRVSEANHLLCEELARFLADGRGLRFSSSAVWAVRRGLIPRRGV